MTLMALKEWEYLAKSSTKKGNIQRKLVGKEA
jgi:hypothetical protein